MPLAATRGLRSPSYALALLAPEAKSAEFSMNLIQIYIFGACTAIMQASDRLWGHVYAGVSPIYR